MRREHQKRSCKNRLSWNLLGNGLGLLILGFSWSSSYALIHESTPGAIEGLDLEASVDQSEMKVGDRLRYSIQVTAPESVQVELPNLVGNLGAFEVKDYQVVEAPPQKGRVARSWNTTLSTFVGGDFVIPPQMIYAIQGSDTLMTHTEPVLIRVLSRIDTSAADLDIEEVEIPLHDGAMPWWQKALWITAGILLLAALIVFLVRRLRRPGAPPPLPPYEEAIQALNALRAHQWLQNEQQAPFFFELGQIFRRYLHRRYAHRQVELMDATSSQLEMRLPKLRPMTQDIQEHLVLFFKETDLVKFARQPMEQDRAAFWDQFADRMLQETRPLAEEEGSPSGENSAAESEDSSTKEVR